jgi:acyl-CoA thioesterase I
MSFIKKNIALLYSVAFLLCFAQCSETAKPQNKATQSNSTTIDQTRKNILFFGNSLTAAYGLDDTQLGFVALIQARIDSLGLPYRCINAGVSGETSAGGAERITFVAKQQPIDIFVLELGANDALRGLPTTDTEKQLSSIFKQVKTLHPNAKLLLAGMESPPQMGQTYAKDFHNVYPKVSAANGAVLLPFLLQGVGGIVELNQKDGIHPNEAGNQIVVENMWAVLKKML